MSDSIEEIRDRIARARRSGNRGVEFELTADLARLLLRAGRPADAVHAAERLVTIAADLGDPAHRRDALLEIGALWHDAGEHARARATFARALEMTRGDGGDAAPQAEIRALAGSGRAQLALGNPSAAAACYEEALADARRCALLPHEAEVLHGLALACKAEGRPEWAADCFREAIVLCRAMQDVRGALQNLDELAGVLLDLGEGAGAALALEEALTLARSRLEQAREMQLLLSLGKAHSLAGCPDLAVIAFEEAHALACNLRCPETEASAQAALCACRRRLALASGD